MKCIQLFLLLLFWGGSIVSVFAQKRNFVTYKDTVTWKDTIITNVSFANENYKKKQYAVSIVNKDGDIIHTYKAEDIMAYKEERTLYISKTLTVNGEVRRVLLPRVYSMDDISMYAFISDRGQKEYYVQIQKDSLLVPLKGDAGTRGVNPMVAYLETFSVPQEEIVKKYIRSMKPSPSSFNSRYRVCRTGNINYIPKVRWGLLAAAGIVDLSYSIYDFGQKLQGFVGLFADFPIIDGLSFHPEFTYREFTQSIDFLLSTTMSKGNAIYNRRDFVMPLMLRYTLISLRGKVLPYIQAGAELEMAFKKETANQYINSDSEGYVTWVESGPILQDKFAVAYTAGIGVEWKLRRNHSLFLDLRYSKENTDTNQTGCYAVISFNL